MASEFRRVKLAHVAMAAGVSVGTASDALNGREGRVSEDTRRRVVAAARRLNYRPDQAARQLQSGTTSLIGMVVQQRSGAELPWPYFPRLQAAFTIELLKYNIVACPMGVSDLLDLDGLPFNLILFINFGRADEQLPDGIRQHYHVLDLDFTSDSGLGHSVREQVGSMIETALEEQAVRSGSTPAFLSARGEFAPQEYLHAIYRNWCERTGRTPVELWVGDESEGADIERLVEVGSKALFTFAIDPSWLEAQLQRREVTLDDFDITCFGALPNDRQVRSRFHVLKPDGDRIGQRLATAVRRALRGQQESRLQLSWTLDGDPWPLEGS